MSAPAPRLEDPGFQTWIIRQNIALVALMAVITVAFVTHDVFKILNPPKPAFFQFDPSNTRSLAALTPLDSPILDETELKQWAVKAVIAAYNVNYFDFPEQFEAAGRRFTTRGWNTFAKQYDAVGNLAKLRKDKMLCYAEPKRVPVIRATAQIRGRLAYDVQFPITQLCENTNQQNPSRLMMTVLIVRTTVAEHPEGHAIEQLVATNQ